MKRKLFAFLLATTLLASLAGCGNGTTASSSATPQDSAAPQDSATPASQSTPEATAEPDKDYKFAVIAPLTGSNSQYGESYKRAIDLLVDVYNNNGGINGGKIVVNYYDDKNDATESVTIATNLASDADLLGVIGSQTSTPSMAIAPIFQKAGIPLVSPNASHDDFTPIGDFIFRATYLQSETAAATARAVVAKAKELLPGEPIEIGLIYMNTDWGVGFYENFTKNVEAEGAIVKVSETYMIKQTQDFTPLLTKIKNAGCNVLMFAPNYSEGGQMVKQAKTLDMDQPIFGSSMLFKQEFLDIAGEDAEGMHVMTMFYSDNPSEAFQNLKKIYGEKYGETASLDEYVVKAYDAMSMLLQGAEATGHSREGIRDYIAGLKDWPGALATITMDEEGNPSGPQFLIKIENGEFVFLG